MRRWLTAGVVFAALLVFWELGVRVMVQAGKWDAVVAPSPLAVGHYLVNAIRDETLFDAVCVTMKRLLFGYLASMAAGLSFGLLLARFKFFQDTLGLMALGLQTLPSVCWLPLALLWFHQTEAAMYFIVIMGSIWSITLATSAGVRSVPPIYARAAATMGSRGLHTWFTVILPASLPFIVSGMKLGWAFAWRSLMAAEMLIIVLTGIGLGGLLQAGRDFIAMDQVMGIMVVIVLIGLMTDKLLFAPFERLMHRRWGTAR